MVAIWILIGMTAAAVPSRVTPCDVIQHLEKFDGRLVSVYGELKSTLGGPDHYFDELIALCPPSDRVVSMKLIPPDAHFLADPPKGYRPDVASIERAEAVLEMAPASSRVFGTVTGFLLRGRADDSIGGTGPKPHHESAVVYLVISGISRVTVSVSNVKPR
jgi:hypothetical protein